MNEDSPDPLLSSAPGPVVVLPDGRRAAIAEGEFRSLDGKLLFVRRGRRIEIRCPRSKALYAVEWESAPEAKTEPGSPPRAASGSPESGSSPTTKTGQ